MLLASAAHSGAVAGMGMALIRLSFWFAQYAADEKEAAEDDGSSDSEEWHDEEEHSYAFFTFVLLFAGIYLLFRGFSSWRRAKQLWHLHGST